MDIIIKCETCSLIQFVTMLNKCRKCGNILIDKDETDLVADRIVKNLSMTQLSIMHLIIESLSNKAIAAKLNTTEQIIKNHCRIIYDETGMGNRLELAMFVLKHNKLRKLCALNFFQRIKVQNQIMGNARRNNKVWQQAKVS